MSPRRFAGEGGGLGRSQGRGRAREGACHWIEVSPQGRLPSLDSGLEGWKITRRRATRWNATTVIEGETFHLKWFFHSRWMPWAPPALREWRARAALEPLDIPTVSIVGWGRHPRGSFVVLRNMDGVPASEWARAFRPPGAQTRLARALGRIVARLHDGGLCHRDLNVYHVWVDGEDLRLIDVGRVAPFRRARWIIKDLASLAYTARREGFSGPAARAFLSAYLSATARRWRRHKLLSAVLAKAARVEHHTEKALQQASLSQERRSPSSGHPHRG